MNHLFRDLAPLSDLGWQEVHLDAGDTLAGREDDCPLDDVAKLPDIARPIVGLERRNRLVRNARRGDAAVRGEAGEEMVRKFRNVLTSVAQRR